MNFIALYHELLDNPNSIAYYHILCINDEYTLLNSKFKSVTVGQSHMTTVLRHFEDMPFQYDVIEFYEDEIPPELYL